MKISFIISLLTSGLCFTQNINTKEQITNEYHKNLSDQYSSILQKQSIKKSNGNVANFIYIEQIGNFNQIYSKTSSTKSNINLSQRGNFNTIDLDIKAYEIDEFVIQRGNHNSFQDFSPHWTRYHGAEVIQYGNDQNLKWFGDNSISEKMKITMYGRDNSMIIRNYN